MRGVDVVSSAEALVAMRSCKYRDQMAGDIVFAAGEAAAKKSTASACDDQTAANCASCGACCYKMPLAEEVFFCYKKICLIWILRQVFF
jgi:hypothetical protein